MALPAIPVLCSAPPYEVTFIISLHCWRQIREPRIDLRLELERHRNQWLNVANLPPAMQAYYESDPTLSNTGQRYTTDIQDSIYVGLSVAGDAVLIGWCTAKNRNGW
jgi:hypothetical protein